jgi:dTDP-4-dehydrorhamnose 3,5-epimerase
LEIVETSLPGVLILEPRVFRDSRGWFMETFNATLFARLGLPIDFAQDNHSASARNVVRGLHYQLIQPQGKLVRCARGAILDVAVDIRRGSPTFGKTAFAELTADNRRMLWIPPGFAHGFSVLEEAEVIYKCTTPWHQPSDRTILWNDPDLAIDWRVGADAIISAKDAAGTPLREAETFEYHAPPPRECPTPSRG